MWKKKCEMKKKMKVTQKKIVWPLANVSTECGKLDFDFHMDIGQVGSKSKRVKKNECRELKIWIRILK